MRTSLQFALLLPGVLAAALSGCTSKGGTREPAELQRIENRRVTADIVWKRSLGGSNGLRSGFEIDVEDDALFAADADGRVYALDPATGKTVWAVDTEARLISGPYADGPLVLVGPVVLIGLDSGRLAALQLASGEPLWEAVVALPSGRTELDRLVDVDAEPIAVAGGVFALSYGGQLVLIDPRSGEPRWERAVRSYTGGTVFGTRGLAVSDADGLMWALDAESGAAVWKQDALQYRGLSPPITVRDRIAVTDFEGYVHFLDPADGRIVGRERPLRAPMQAQPVLSGERLYLLDVEGRLVALEIDEQ